MTAVATMTTRIAAELNRADDSDLIALIPGWIDDAVGELSHRRCLFNEKVSTFTTIAGTWNYSESTVAPGALPAGIVELDEVSITVSGLPIAIDPVEFSLFMDYYRGSTVTGYPDRYTLYGGTLYLHPIPNAAYVVTLSFLQDLATETWATEAEQLVRSCAKKNAYLHYLGNTEKAAAMGVAEQAALRTLRRRAWMQQATGRVTPSE